MKRVAYYESLKTILDNEIRRFVILCGARRTGKTTIMYKIKDCFINKVVPPKNIIFVSFNYPLLKLCSIDQVIGLYKKDISS